MNRWGTGTFSRCDLGKCSDASPHLHRVITRWWLIGCVHLAEPQYPDTWSNTSLDVAVKLFMMRSAFKLVDV